MEGSSSSSSKEIAAVVVDGAAAEAMSGPAAVDRLARETEGRGLSSSILIHQDLRRAAPSKGVAGRLGRREVVVVAVGRCVRARAFRISCVRDR